MAANSLMDYTLVVDRVNYKGKYFKDFIITNANIKYGKMPERLHIKKIIVVSDANFSQGEVFDALISLFGPISAAQKDEAVIKWLKECSSVDALSDMMNECRKDESLNVSFHNALYDPIFNVNDIVLL